MATDIWTGSGDWTADLGDWSLGAAPTSAQNADIEGGVTLYGSGVAFSLQIGANGGMQTGASSTLTLGGYLDVYAQYTQIGFQGRLTVAGDFINAGDVAITSSSAATSVTVGALVNNGQIEIQGGTTQALLKVNTAPTGGFSGGISLSGNAALQYSGTGAAVVNTGASLEIDGAAASVTFAGVSALTLLSANLGTLWLEGDTSLGSGGVSFTNSGGFLSDGNTNIDSFGGSGGSRITFGGALTVAAGSLTLGNQSLSATTSLTVASLLNQGSVYVEGSTGGGAGAALNVNSAAPSTLTGQFDVIGDASIVYSGGGVSSIQAGASVVLGYGGQMLANGASALAGLAVNYGAVDVEDDALSTSVALRNFGNLTVDNSAQGGGSLKVGGAVYNYGALLVGNTQIETDDALQVSQLFNQGTVFIQGATSGAAQAKLSVGSAAAANLTGDVEIDGDGDLAFTSGQIANVQAGSTLALIGSTAEVTSGATSALGGLRLNYGEVDFRGDEYNGTGGAQVATTGSFRNTGTFNVDSVYDDGASQISFDGAISNYSTPYHNEAVAAGHAPAAPGRATGIYIGNAELSHSTTVSATSFLNEGYLFLQGSAAGDDEATLSISGAANPALTGAVQIGGDATLKYGSGGISNVQYGSGLQLFGAGAQILAGAQSGLATLASNFGAIALNGNISYLGEGGATAAVAGAFTNYGSIQIDDDYLASGSSFSVGGAFTNDAFITVGNYVASGTTPLLQASSLTNNSVLQIGAGGGPGEALVNGAAVNTGAVTIGAEGALTVTGGASYTQNSGVTFEGGALSASSVVVNGGTIEFETALNADDVIGGFVIGSAGQLRFDGAVDSARMISFGAVSGKLVLADSSAFAGSISNFAGSDMIEIADGVVTGFSYAGTSSAGALTLQLSNGTADTLHFLGAYARSSFLTIPAVGGATYIVRNVGQDVWSGSGDWDANPADWSAGAPPAGKNVIVSPVASLIASGVDKAGAVTVLDGAELGLALGSSWTAASLLNESGVVDDYAATATISGALTNAGGRLDLLAASAGADVTLSAASFSSFGDVDLQGGGSAGGPKAKLAIAGYAPTTLYGVLTLSGQATLAFGNGAITTVGDDAALDIYGGGAAITSGGHSALTGLAVNYGSIELEGYAGVDDGGVTLQTTGAFLNTESLMIDTFSSGGGDQIGFGGVLTNAGYLAIGNSLLTHNTAVSAGGLVNQGELQLEGGAALTGAHTATLTIAANAGAIFSGEMIISGAATLKYAGGGITSIEYGALLEMYGANARLLAGSASALSGLAANAGTLYFEGDSSSGDGGVTQSLSANFSNYSIFGVDNLTGGGSVVTIAGAFLNTGEATIGNTGLQANTTLNVNALVNEGSLSVQGSVSGTDEALLNVATNAAASLSGDWQIGGHAALHFAGGAINTIQYQASLEIDGAGASLTAGSVSALKTLNVNAGQLILNGDGPEGGGGVTLTTSVGLTNSGEIEIDQDYSSGGAQVAFGGAVINTGEISIGNSALAADDTLSMASLVNEGRLYLYGLNGNVGAKVNVGSVAAGAITGSISLSSNATLAYTGGGFTSVQAGASLSVNGDGQILAGASSALATLAANYGALDFESGSYFGTAPSLTIGQAFTNYGQFSLDAQYYDGGSAITIHGALTNDGQLMIGNAPDSAGTVFGVSSLVNSGDLQLNGDAALNASGGAVNRGQIQIGAGATLNAGASAFIQYAGETQIASGGQLKASAVDAFGGLIDVAESVTSGDGLGNFVINGVGELEFEAGVDASHTVTFTQTGGVLALTSGAAFNGVIHGFSGSDAIDLLGVTVSGFAYSGGTLTLQTSGGPTALHFAGSYATSAFTTMSDGAGGAKVLFV